MRQLHLALAALLLALACLSRAAGDGAESDGPRVALASVEADALAGQGAASEKELKDLLAWAIEHSDPEELRRQAAGERQDAATFAERKARVQALMAQMKQEPTEQELMREALAVAGNASESPAQREAALTALRYLVEPIDNANDLPGMGGLPLLLELLQQREQDGLQAAAAYALGTAASNNARFQAAVLSSTPAVSVLLQNARSGSEAVAEKALYALSALVSSNREGHAQFFAAGGVALVRQRLGRAPGPAQLRKLLNLVTDLTDVHGGEVEGQEAFADAELARRMLALLEHPDWDVRERALLGLVSLASHPAPRASVRAAGGRAAVAAAEAAARERLRDTGEEDREALQHFLVLLVDLGELLHEGSDRTEL